MSGASSLRYCPIAAYYVPVMVALVEDAGPQDALEEAVLALVGINQGFVHQLAQTLCVADELVESALAELTRRHLIKREREEDAYLLSEQAMLHARPRERPGYVLWDSLLEQPTLHLILGRPHDEPHIPDGIEVLKLKPGRPPRPPKHSHLERAVRSLPDVPDLRVLVAFGHSYRSADSAIVQRITYAPRRKLRSCQSFVPIEFRPMCEPIVWRPVVVPSFEMETSLDPEGYGGLKRRAPDAERELDRLRMELDPKLFDLLRSEGYRDAEELFQDAERRVQRELVGAWGNPDWQEVQQAAIEAMRQTILAKFLNSSLHGGLHAWADVLERAICTLLSRLINQSVYDSWGNLDKDAIERALVTKGRILGHLATQLAKDIKPPKKDGLVRAVDKGTLGSRLLALIALWLALPSIAQQINPILRGQPDFFRKLDRTIKERNRVVHPGEEGFPNPRAFRNATLELVAAMMQCA